jgi:hypothetical protein
MRVTFAALPDVPLSRLALTMWGGRRGLLVNNTSLCRTVPRAGVALSAQNGKVRRTTRIAAADCPKGGEG